VSSLHIWHAAHVPSFIGGPVGFFCLARNEKTAIAAVGHVDQRGVPAGIVEAFHER